MRITSDRPRLLIAVNSSIATGFLQGHAEYFKSSGFDVTVVCPERRVGEWEVAKPDSVRHVAVPIAREISPFQDLISTWRLCRILRAFRPAITNVGTPKAGLLGGFAAWWNKVPCRFYTLHGLRFETTTGLRRRLLIFAERLPCRFAHRVVCVSHSVREEAIAHGLVERERTIIPGVESCNGIDMARYVPTPERIKRAAELREQFKIPEGAPIVLFVGRLTADKGIAELARAFLRLDQQFPAMRLLLVGTFEEGDPLPKEIRSYLETHERIILAGPVNDPAPYYAISDFLVLPIHREGLPTVVLEAHAAGKAVVGAEVTGIVDLIAHGKTGLLFPVGNISALVWSIAMLVADKRLAAKLGQAGQEQVRRNFQQGQIWEGMRREYLKVLHREETPHASVLSQPQN